MPSYSLTNIPSHVYLLWQGRGFPWNIWESLRPTWVSPRAHHQVMMTTNQVRTTTMITNQIRMSLMSTKSPRTMVMNMMLRWPLLPTAESVLVQTPWIIMTSRKGLRRSPRARVGPRLVITQMTCKRSLTAPSPITKLTCSVLTLTRTVHTS